LSADEDFQMAMTPEINPRLDQELINDLNQPVSSRIADFF